MIRKIVVAGIFKPGQLVGVNPMLLGPDEKLDLFNVPGGIVRFVDDQINVISWLKVGDVALVVARDRTDGSAVYVLGPHGGGWALGAFMKILKEEAG